jgi:hypothetical protein
MNLTIETDIYNQRQGKKQIPKDPTIYINADGISDIIGKHSTTSRSLCELNTQSLPMPTTLAFVVF